MLRRPFQRELVLQQFVAPHDAGMLAHALDALGVSAEPGKLKLAKLKAQPFPLLLWLSPRPPVSPTTEDAVQTTSEPAAQSPSEPVERSNAAVPALVLQADATQALLIEPGDTAPRVMTLQDLQARYLGHILRLATKVNPGADPDNEAVQAQSRRFGFGWFVLALL